MPTLTIAPDLVVGLEAPTATVQLHLGGSVTVGGGFSGDHNDLPGRSAADAHPIAAITGLQEALDALAEGTGQAVVVVTGGIGRVFPAGFGGSDNVLDGTTMRVVATTGPIGGPGPAWEAAGGETVAVLDFETQTTPTVHVARDGAPWEARGGPLPVDTIIVAVSSVHSDADPGALWCNGVFVVREDGVRLADGDVFTAIITTLNKAQGIGAQGRQTDYLGFGAAANGWTEWPRGNGLAVADSWAEDVRIELDHPAAAGGFWMVWLPTSPGDTITLDAQALGGTTVAKLDGVDTPASQKVLTDPGIYYLWPDSFAGFRWVYLHFPVFSGGGGAGASLSDGTPQRGAWNGSPGTGDEVSRWDHVHPDLAPSIAQLLGDGGIAHWVDGDGSVMSVSIPGCQVNLYQANVTVLALATGMPVADAYISGGSTVTFRTIAGDQYLIFALGGWND